MVLEMLAHHDEPGLAAPRAFKGPLSLTHF